MAQPKATSRSPRLMARPLKRAATSPSGSFTLGPPRSRAPAVLAVALEHEGPVVDAAFGAEALGQAAAPGPLLALALWSGRGTTSASPAKAWYASAHAQAGADQDVLVGEGQQGPAVLVAEQQAQRLLGLGRPVDGGQPDRAATASPRSAPGWRTNSPGACCPSRTR